VFHGSFIFSISPCRCMTVTFLYELIQNFNQLIVLLPKLNEML